MPIAAASRRLHSFPPGVFFSRLSPAVYDLMRCCRAAASAYAAIIVSRCDTAAAFSSAALHTSRAADYVVSFQP